MISLAMILLALGNYTTSASNAICNLLNISHEKNSLNTLIRAYHKTAPLSKLNLQYGNKTRTIILILLNFSTSIVFLKQGRAQSG